MTTATSAAQPLGESVPGCGPDVLRSVMRQHAKGVAVVTAGLGAPAGLCVTSLASVSLRPPLVSFAVGPATSSWPTVRSAQRVMAHLLADGQEDIADRFARSGPAKFSPPTRWHRGPFGLPVLDGVLAWMVLAPASHLPVGDHVLVISKVIAARTMAGGGPLIHYNGEFTRLAAAGST